MKTKIFVYTVVSENKPIEASLALLNYTNEIIKDQNRADFTITSVIFSKETLNEDEKNTLYISGADSIFNVVLQNSEYDLNTEVKALQNVIKIEHPDIFLFSTTDKQKEVAPYLATAINSGLTAECTSLDIVFEGGMPELLATRPTFGGKLMAQIAFKGYPQMATVRSGVSNVKQNYNFVSKEFKKMSFDPENKFYVKTLESYPEILQDLKLETTARVIFSAGFGIGSSNNFNKLQEIVNKLQKLGVNASLGASRKAVEKGFAPRELQIGQTGSFVSPDLYVMLGISGAIHHMVALQGCSKIIAINTDDNAPIATQSDVFVKASAEEFMQKMLEIL